MEQVVEENEELRNFFNRQQAAQRNAVETKANLQFPNEILMMMGTREMTAQVQRVTCVHTFETMPKSKCAVAYEVLSPRHNNDLIYIVLVFSTNAN